MGDVVVNKTPSIENLTDPFTKTSLGKFFYSHEDNIGVKCVSSIF